KVRWFNSTVTTPLLFTLLLAAVGYAVHNKRLVELDFYLPWSKIRKRKTAFYASIQAMITEIADLRTVKGIVGHLSYTLECPVVLLGGPQPAATMAGEALGVARFPMDELRKIDQIVVANE